MSQLWKIGLPMYLLSEQNQDYYDLFLQYFIKEIKRLGFKDNIEIISKFPEDLYIWWQEQDVLFTQCCGYPLIKSLKDQVQLIAKPDYAVVGCENGYYRSVLITHRDNIFDSLNSFIDQRIVINQIDSNSGMNVLRAEIAALVDDKPYFQTVKISGSHLNSIQAITEHRADLAAIDCVSFAYIEKFRPELLKDIRILSYSVQSPALPIIASKKLKDQYKNLVFHVLKNMLKLHPQLCQALLIKDFLTTDLKEYQKILDLEKQAQLIQFDFNQDLSLI